MLGLFNKKKNFASTNFFVGNTDWHCHILPGVDDGIGTMDDALKVLAYYETLGIQTIWLTPHIMEDVPNTPDFLRQRFSELTEAYTGPIRLHLAAENMLDTLFDERLKRNELLPLGERGNFLLVETSFYNPPFDLMEELRRIQAKGYHPMLAHPERYLYLQMEQYDELHDMGVYFQVNLPSLAGLYGEPQLKRAHYLLKKGYYHLWGSDLHRLAGFQKALAQKTLTNRILEQLSFNYELVND